MALRETKEFFVNNEEASRSSAFATNKWKGLGGKWEAWTKMAAHILGGSISDEISTVLYNEEEKEIEKISIEGNIAQITLGWMKEFFR